jgi:hypothetical protein
MCAGLWSVVDVGAGWAYTRWESVGPPGPWSEVGVCSGYAGGALSARKRLKIKKDTVRVRG